MHKLPLKKALALSLTAIIAFVIAAACLYVAPMLDGIVNGTFVPLFDVVNVLLSSFTYLLQFGSYVEILIVAAAGVSVVLLIFWFVMLLVKKQPKHLIPFFLGLVSGLGSVVIAAFYLCGVVDSSFLLNWLFEQLMNNVYYGAVILSIVAIILAAVIVLFVWALCIIEIIDLFRFEKKAQAKESVPFDAENLPKEEAQEEALAEEPIPEPVPAPAAAKVKEEPKQEHLPMFDERPAPAVAESAPRSSSQFRNVEERIAQIDDEAIRRIVHEEVEILYIRLLKYRLVDIAKEEKEMLKDEDRRNQRRETDEEYYNRMIEELPMFNRNRKPAARPAPAPQPAPRPIPRPVQPAPAPAPRPVRPAPAPAPAPVAKPKIIRIPFEKRIATVDKTMKAHFNELKSDILAYGVKSRVSNSGDTFRLHTVTYVKITIAGKSLKLYLALNPKDYKDTTIPFSDASHKGIYKEIPFVFKVKSELSLRRAKQLIADAMAKGGLEQGRVEPHDWVKEIVGK